MGAAISLPGSSGSDGRANMLPGGRHRAGGSPHRVLVVASSLTTRVRGGSRAGIAARLREALRCPSVWPDRRAEHGMTSTPSRRKALKPNICVMHPGLRSVRRGWKAKEVPMTPRAPAVRAREVAAPILRRRPPGASARPPDRTFSTTGERAPRDTARVGEAPPESLVLSLAPSLGGSASVRALVTVRELCCSSPLADAVFAVQGLCANPAARQTKDVVDACSERAHRRIPYSPTRGVTTASPPCATTASATATAGSSATTRATISTA